MKLTGREKGVFRGGVARGRWRALAMAAMMCATPLWAHKPPAGASPHTPPATQTQAPPAMPANAIELVREVVGNELAQRRSGQHFTWRERVQKPSRTVVKQYVSTPEGIVGRYVQINGQPLNAEERRIEDARVERLRDPRLMAKKRNEQKNDEQRVLNIVRALPDAFHYAYAGQPELLPNGHWAVKLIYQPNPGFNPPSRETYVFQGMNGSLTLDVTARRILRLEGSLFRDVSIGWGIIGKLYRGGRILIEQAEVSRGHWDQTNLLLDFYGKALLFKNIRINEHDLQYDFQPAPAMTAAQAVDYLKRFEK